MKVIFYFNLLLISVFLLFYGCKSVVPDTIQRHWNQTYETKEYISPVEKFDIEVIAESLPLPGDNSIKVEIIKNKLIELLGRRGYVFDKKSSKYKFILRYKTQQHEVQSVSSVLSNTNSNLSISASQNRSNFGVAIAQLVSLISNKTESKVSTTIKSTPSLVHTLTLDVLLNPGKYIWRGESIWESEYVNFDSDFIESIQLILSNLPQDPNIKPNVSEVKESHAVNYFNLKCADHYFTCPALPNKIYFKLEGNSKTKGLYDLPKEIKDPNCLEAFVDLMENSEFALPEGSKKFEKPLDQDLWSDVKLGGKYLLGKFKIPINILIELTGEKDGYVVKNCKVVNDDEFYQFSSKLETWKRILRDFYDIYKE